MGKRASKNFGNKKSNLIVDKKIQDNDEKKKKVEDKILELSDDEIEKLFEDGKINQLEYEYILDYRKKLKDKNKTQKEKFEERIRCNNTIINKIIQLGRKFRSQENIYKKEASLQAMLEANQDLEREERERDRKL